MNRIKFRASILKMGQMPPISVNDISVVLSQSRHLPFNFIRQKIIVRIQKLNVLSPCLIQGSITRVCRAAIGSVYQKNLISESAKSFKTGIGGTIIHHDNFNGRMGLPASPAYCPLRNPMVLRYSMG